MNRSTALLRFHLSGGARVAARNAIATIGLIIIVLGSAPDPWVWLRFLAVGVAASGVGSGPLIGLALIAVGLARDAVPRLTLGLGGWTRSLPATLVHHRRAVTYALPMIQLPLAAAVVVAAVLTAAAYHVPLSGPKLIGAPVALVAAGAAVVPARRGFLSAPAFLASAFAAVLGHWATLAIAIALFVVADLAAGPLRFAVRRSRVASPAMPGTLPMFRFTWRAVGWRLLAPLPAPALALAAAWFYTRNNELVGPDVSFVARLWSVIAIALYVGAVADVMVTRRPAWPWVRSLPWSSTARAADDALAIGVPGAVVALASGIVDARTVVVSLALLPPIAALGVLLSPGARRRLTRVSGALIAIGIGLAIGVAFYPLLSVPALAMTPVLIRAAARRDRGQVVTGWHELHHDATGDSLAWSVR
jgi:hypothetical protein